MLKNIFSKKQDFSVFDQPLISGTGQGPEGYFQGPARAFSGAQ